MKYKYSETYYDDCVVLKMEEGEAIFSTTFSNLEIELAEIGFDEIVKDFKNEAKIRFNQYKNGF